VPNYLNTLNAAVRLGRDFDVTGEDLSQAATNAGWAAANALANGQNPFSSAVNSGLSSIPGAQTAVGIVNQVTGGALGALGIGVGGGSKPKALHTEYAAGAASWSKPYGAGTDVVFYLMRADAGSPSAPGTETAATSSIGESAARIAANVQAGPGTPDALQSPLSQIALSAKSSLDTRGRISSNQGLLGPLSNLDYDLEISPGGVSQSLAKITSTKSAVANAVSASASFSTQMRRSFPGSESFFSQTLNNSFNPGLESVLSDPVSRIENTFNRTPVAELSSRLAEVTRGIASTKDLIESVNHGEVGRTTEAAAALAGRISPQRYVQRSRK